jgi:hypothetical protein
VLRVYTGARIHAIGYRDARPVKVGGRELARFANRRVVVVVDRSPSIARVRPPENSYGARPPDVSRSCVVTSTAG